MLRWSSARDRHISKSGIQTSVANDFVEGCKIHLWAGDAALWIMTKKKKKKIIDDARSKRKEGMFRSLVPASA